MKNLLSILLITVVINLPAQSDYKFKKVTAEMLSQTEHELEPDATAAFLYNGFDGDFEYVNHEGAFEFIFTISQRIKIYKEDGKSFGDFSIPLYFGNNSSREQILDIDAFTFNLKEGKVSQVKLQKKDLYVEEVNEFWSRTKFAMPNVQEGSIIEVRYKVRSPFTYRVSEFYMQHEIPVDYAYYEIGIPEYFGYSPLVKGIYPLKMEEDSKRGFITYTYTEDNSTNTLVKRKKVTEKIDYALNIKRFKGENIPSMKAEKFVHNMNNYRTSIAYELLYTNYPNSTMKQYSATWDQVAETLEDAKGFGGQLKVSKKESKKIISSISAESEEGRLKEIYEYINQNFAWNGERKLYGNGVNKLLKEGKGNSADINLLLISTLRQAGFTAHPVACKTRDQGYLNVTFPSIADLNYVFAVVVLGEKYIYLDATVPGFPMGSLPLRAINLHGVLMNGKTGSKIDIANPNESSKLEYLTLKFAEGKLSGTKTIKRGKLAGYEERSYLQNIDSNDDLIASLNEDNSKLKVSSCEHKNKDNRSLDLTSTLEVDYTKYIQEIAGKVFIPLLLDQGWEENPFRSEERFFNVFFDEKIESRSIIALAIPEGYVVESIPESVAIALPGSALVFRLTISAVVGGTISINGSLIRNVPSITAEAYPDLRAFYDELVKKTKEQIVLVKS